MASTVRRALNTELTCLAAFPALCPAAGVTLPKSLHLSGLQVWLSYKADDDICLSQSLVTRIKQDNRKHPAEYLECSRLLINMCWVSCWIWKNSLSKRMLLRLLKNYLISLRCCLQLITDRPAVIEEELDLIQALGCLEEFGVKILPLQGGFSACCCTIIIFH